MQKIEMKTERYTINVDKITYFVYVIYDTEWVNFYIVMDSYGNLNYCAGIHKENMPEDIEEFILDNFICNHWMDIANKDSLEDVAFEAIQTDAPA